MNERIRELALQSMANVRFWNAQEESYGVGHDELAEFAELVAAAARADVREACAKFFDDNDINLFWGSQVARHIRERGTT